MFNKTITVQNISPNISHNESLKFNFNQIAMDEIDIIKAITICIELPRNIKTWIKDYKYNLLKEFKILDDSNFLFNVKDFFETTQQINRNDDDNKIYISVLPYKDFNFNFFIFENAFTQLTLRPLKLLYEGPIINFIPVIKLIVEFDKECL